MLDDLKSKVWQFEEAKATVVFENEPAAGDAPAKLRLYIQAHDAYGFQREWTLKPYDLPGWAEGAGRWHSCIYQHPDRREACSMAGPAAEKVLRRFIEICERHPAMLFNATNDRFARCDGFVQFAERLHRGEEPQADML